jgi:DNA-binding LytR/AlgR family response regulator
LKLNVFVDKAQEERIDIYIKEKSRIVEDIEKLISQDCELLCYKDGEVYKLSFSEIVLFSVENEKVAVFTENDKFFIRERLYMIEEKMPSAFIKLNQSAIGNIKKIKKFDCSVSGTLKVTFTNGLTDFVSRRQVKAVKERLGL